MNKEFYDKIYDKYLTRTVDMTPESFEQMMESATSDFEKKVILVSVLDTPKLKLGSPEWKPTMWKYSKELLEIRELNRLDPLLYTPGWYPETVTE